MIRCAFFIACALLLSVAGCGDNDHPTSPDAPPSHNPDGGDAGGDNPYGGVELSETLTFSDLDAPVHVVRDELGILHVRASTVADLAFAQGYLLAHDRLPQMDLLRRFGAGTLSELFGALSQDIVETDLGMRMHRMTPLAEEAYAELQASSDPTDQKIVTILDRYADGVNAYAADLAAKKYELDSAVATSFHIDTFEPWTPVDSLVLGRFQAFALSYGADNDLEVTQIYQSARKTFATATAADPAKLARKKAAQDLARIKPIGLVSPIDGFPKSDTSTERAPTAKAAAGPAQPDIPGSLLANARAAIAQRMLKGPRAFMWPRAGSNDWVVGPKLAGGKALLAGDQHLNLPNPSIFYPMHLVVPGQFDAEGVTFPGIPGIILGHNGKVAWSATVVAHDVTDIYHEDIVPCDTGTGDCTVFNGEQVPLETWTEELEVGLYGTPNRTITATYEKVPHHGPIFPVIENGAVVPRSETATPGEALSVKFTGYEVSNEIRTFIKLLYAQDADEAVAAFDDFDYGAQNFVIIDSQGNIAWTTHAKVPLRAKAAYTWNRETNPAGLAPFFVLPGDGSAEWEGYIDPSYLPQAKNPDQGFIATANSDPVGATFDFDPFNDGTIEGRPLYMSAFYAPGLRTERIAQLIEDKAADDEGVTADDMSAIQLDSRSTLGSHLLPAVVSALGQLEAATPRADVAAYLASLPPGRKARLIEAAGYLKSWTLETPPAVAADATAAEINDSVATTLFNSWLHFFVADALGDEFDAMGLDIYTVLENLTARLMVGLLVEPESLATGINATTNQPVLCDDMTTAGLESCDLEVIKALDEAVAWAEDDGFATTDMSAWRWGKVHTLTIKPLFPNDALNVPPPTDATYPNGFPKPGDTFVVNRADCGFNNLAFNQNADGPAERFVAWTTDDGEIRARISIPGGTIYDRGSTHYDDLLRNYYLPGTQADMPYTTEDIVAHGETRWLFTP
ncbi:MAG TPA: penicillin acylase family protein [Kofleriaceae bacterium]|nr:penicillin acylase family protein [Kofleriaceae bacterium]